MTLEKWRTITEYQGHKFDGKYEISNWGNMRNVKTKVKKAYFSDQRGQGYYKTKIFDVNGVSVPIKISRLVAYCFLPPPKEGENEINHIDGNPKNNSFTNLEWCTHQHNMNHFKVNKQVDPTQLVMQFE